MGMQKSTDVIWLAKIRWFLGVHLASALGGYATLLNMHVSAEVNKTIPMNKLPFRKGFLL